jgi:hypothetical protein
LLWAAALALATAPAATRAFAADAGTLVLTGNFHMDYLDGAPGTELSEVFAHGADHTWTLKLYEVTYGHEEPLLTNVFATSFDLVFSGPDADALNLIAGQHGELANLWMQNHLDGGGYSVWGLDLLGSAFRMQSDHAPWIDADVNGYPLVPPHTLHAEETAVGDATGTIVSLDDDVTVTEDVGPPPPPPLPALSIADRSVAEGSRGKSQMTFDVALSTASLQTVTVRYRTADGTAVAKADYTPISGTLTLRPGERSNSITVQLKADRVREAHETFTVVLSDPVGATIGDGVAVGTILNDD